MYRFSVGFGSVTVYGERHVGGPVCLRTIRSDDVVFSIDLGHGSSEPNIGPSQYVKRVVTVRPGDGNLCRSCGRTDQHALYHTLEILGRRVDNIDITFYNTCWKAKDIYALPGEVSTAGEGIRATIQCGRAKP